MGRPLNQSSSAVASTLLNGGGVELQRARNCQKAMHPRPAITNETEISIRTEGNLSHLMTWATIVVRQSI
jgi:hypothetical protein